MRVTIRVRPGAGRTAVGGEHGGALVVRVAARAVEGQANEAALIALAGAFGVRRRSVTLVTGATSRTKIVDVAGGEQAVLDRLLAG
ncbi:MAG TPA: DUF167 domain-containing protein [Streptosporangiaceae bacterium]|nr:DUF167 domain-containing protein [Streptosporangiaceae bacterium]